MTVTTPITTTPFKWETTAAEVVAGSRSGRQPLVIVDR